MARRKDPHPLAVLLGGMAVLTFVGGALALLAGDDKKKQQQQEDKKKQEEQQRGEQARRDAEAAARAERAVRAFAEKTLSDVCALFRIPRPPMHFGEDVPNFNSDGHRIGMNPRWAREVVEAHCANASCNQDVLRWFIAHEVGHHVAGDGLLPRWIPLEKEQRHMHELRADYFAGFALAHFGGDVRNLEDVLRTHAAVETATHPDFAKRIRAAREGFVAAGASRAA